MSMEPLTRSETGATEFNSMKTVRLTARPHNRFLAAIFALFAGGLNGMANAITIRDDVPDSSYTALAAQPDYNPVGQVYSNVGFWSGTLISSRWILTAGHVLGNGSSYGFSVGGTNYNADQTIVNPGWDGTDNGFDVGLIRLTTAVPFTGSSAIIPAVRYAGSAELGATATIVGFGMTGTGLTGEQSGTAGYKRAGQNVFDVLGGSVVGASQVYSNNYLFTDFDQPGHPEESSFGSATPLPLECCLADGDSGAGTFITVGGAPRLAGVGTTGDVGPNEPYANCKYGDISGFIRVALFNDWIDDTIAVQWTNPSGGAAGAAANWQNAILPDATDILGFNVNGTYTVNFAGANTYSKILVRTGNVTLDLGGTTQTVNSAMLNGSVTVGRDSGDVASLTLTDGVLSAVDAQIGRSTGATGTVTLTGAGTQWNLSDSLYLGGSNSAAGGTGTLTVNAGTSVFVAGTLTLWSPAASLNLNGGTVTAANLNFSGGTISGTSGGALIVTGPNSSWSGGEFTGTATTMIAAGASLDISASGSTSWSLNNSSGGMVDVSAGTINLNGGGTSTGGEFSTAAGATLNFGSNYSFDAATTITNAGTIGFSNGTFVLNGTSFTNSGTLEISSGALEFDTAPILSNNSVVQVNGGTLRFKVSSGTATVGTGVTVTVAGGATLELAGSVSAFAAGSNRVNVTNNSTAAPAGLLVSGTGQHVGSIDGSGSTQVNAGSDLTADHIIQSALVIGGTASAPATLTIDASDSLGNPQTGGLVLAASLIANGPFGAVTGSTSLTGDLAGSGSNSSGSLLGGSIDGTSRGVVPEPATITLSLIGLLGFLSLRRRWIDYS